MFWGSCCDTFTLRHAVDDYTTRYVGFEMSLFWLFAAVAPVNAGVSRLM